MLAAVMDTGSHLKRPWDDQQRHRSPDNRPVAHSMTDSGGMISNIPQLHKMPSPSHMLPPIVTATEQPLRQMQTDRLAGTSSLPGAPPHTAYTHPSQDASSKRPRIYYDAPYQPESGRGQPSAHATPPNIQSAGHERHDQHQWSVRDPMDPEGMRRPRGTCPTCLDSRGLVEKVVSGLERLEAELRQVLAAGQFGRTPKQVSYFA
jgi:hypothetical protein